MSYLFIILLIGVLLFLILFLVKRNKTKNPVQANHDQIYVGNLPYRVDESDLKKYFSQFGAVQSVKVVKNFKTGRSKGYAFVTFAYAKQAVKALSAHGQELQGRLMVVRIAKQKQGFAEDYDDLESADNPL